MILRRPFFFLLVDSWVVSAGGVVVVVAAAAGAASGVAGVGDAASDDAGAASGVAASVAGAASDAFSAGAMGLALPGVTVSTVAVLPGPEPMLMFGPICGPKLSVSSPDSLAGVIVGAPLCDAVETSGRTFRKLVDRVTSPGRAFAASVCSFFIRASATGSGGGMGIPNLVSL